jgi:hypothetical protein
MAKFDDPKYEDGDENYGVIGDFKTREKAQKALDEIFLQIKYKKTEGEKK